MANVEPTAALHAGFSAPGADARPWADVLRVLIESEMFWLSTVRRDGRPHVTPLPAIWLDGALHFCAGSEEQKTRNLMADPRCILTTGTNALHSGLDVVVEGSVERVLDRATLTGLARIWKEKLEWDFEVGATGFVDPSGHHALVFALAPTKILSFSKDDDMYAQTRYRFG